MRAAYDFDDLPSFLAQYYEGVSGLRREEDFYDLAMAYFARVAAQGLVYVELFFDPQVRIPRQSVHPFHANPASDSRVSVHPSGEAVAALT